MAGGTRHILLTGGTSGIGLEAAALLHQAGHRLTLPCREGKAAETLARLLPGAHTPLCDLADLANVERCAADLLAAAAPIDTLVLNAGLQYAGAAKPRWSAQGFELTLGVNHLAHQALLQRLLPLLLAGREPRLVITASDVHDPKAPGGAVGRPAGLGNLEGLGRGVGAAMVDGNTAFDAQKAYGDSKLCNVLLARHVERLLREQGRPLPVVAWSPGLVIPRSEGGFFRESRRHNPLGQAAFGFLARDLLRVTETPKKAGALLARLAADPLPEPNGFQYWSNRIVAPGRHRFAMVAPSAEAQNEELAERLWILGAGHLGLDPQPTLGST